MELIEAADYISARLAREGVAIHRYDAITSKSIYLKFDFGVAHSLRISDHKGYKHLAYRYNLMKNEKGKRTVTDRGYKRTYYGMDWIDALIRDILQAREDKIKRDGAMYDHAVKKAQKDARAGMTKFWRGAEQIAPYTLTSKSIHAMVMARQDRLQWGIWDTGREEAK